MKREVLSMMYALAAFIFASCEHKDLCYNHLHTGTVNVIFDWKNAPEANPEGMCVFFYPLEGGSPQRFDFRGKTGGQIKVEVGTYRILCYNNDTEAVLFRNTSSFDTHEGFTRNGSIFESIYGNSAHTAPRAEGAEDERVLICPDMMWGCNAIDVEVTEAGIDFICVPTELICTYTYEIRNVKNLEHATQMCGSLSGMSSSMRLVTEELGTECVTLPFEATSDGVSTITGKFYTFGHHPENAAAHRMLLYVWMDDGSKYYYGRNSDKFNVTQQIHAVPDKRRVHIIIDGLDLPQPIEGDGGFDPSVDDWTDVEQDIIM